MFPTVPHGSGTRSTGLDVEEHSRYEPCEYALSDMTGSKVVAQADGQ